jgi:hypothetical protein
MQNLLLEIPYKFKKSYGGTVLRNRRPPRMHPGCADPLLKLSLTNQRLQPPLAMSAQKYEQDGQLPDDGDEGDDGPTGGGQAGGDLNHETWSRMSDSVVNEGSEPFSSAFWGGDEDEGGPSNKQLARIEDTEDHGREIYTPDRRVRSPAGFEQPGGSPQRGESPQREADTSFSSQMGREEQQARLDMFWGEGNESGRGDDFDSPSTRGGGDEHAVEGVRSGGRGGGLSAADAGVARGLTVDPELGWHGSDGEFVPPHVARMQEDAAKRRAMTPVGPVPRPSENRRLALNSRGGARRIHSNTRCARGHAPLVYQASVGMAASHCPSLGVIALTYPRSGHGAPRVPSLQRSKFEVRTCRGNHRAQHTSALAPASDAWRGVWGAQPTRGGRRRFRSQRRTAAVAARQSAGGAGPGPGPPAPSGGRAGVGRGGANSRPGGRACGGILRLWAERRRGAAGDGPLRRRDRPAGGRRRREQRGSV